MICYKCPKDAVVRIIDGNAIFPACGKHQEGRFVWEDRELSGWERDYRKGVNEEVNRYARDHKL